MISIDTLLDMIATEAVEACARYHYFDESRNRGLVPPEHRYKQPEDKTKLPYIRFDLELLKLPDGSYKWVE